MNSYTPLQQNPRAHPSPLQLALSALVLEQAMSGKRPESFDDLPPNLQALIHALVEECKLFYYGQMTFATNRPAIPPPPQEVDIDQIAACARISKRAMRAYLPQMPAPSRPGRGGRKTLWLWDEVKPWLEKEFRISGLPERLSDGKRKR